MFGQMLGSQVDHHVVLRTDLAVPQAHDVAGPPTEEHTALSIGGEPPK